MAQADEETYQPAEKDLDYDPGEVATEGAQPGTEGAPQAERDKHHKPDRSHRHSNALVEWALIVVVALAAALLIKAFAIQAFFIPSASMEPTLFPGDHVLVNKLSYDVHNVNTGDVIVFRRPPADNSSDVGDLIKRVVGLPGQTISVANCRVYINGKELSQPYLPKGWQAIQYCTTWVGGPGTANLHNPYTVPKGEYFVMGDNRMDSDDSRYWADCPPATSSAGHFSRCGR